MKLTVLGILALTCIPVLGQAATPEKVTDFQWSGDDMGILNRLPAFNGNPYTDSASVGGRVDEPPRLTIHYALSQPLQITIRTLGPAIASRVISKHYAITGKVSYEGVPAGSYLEMWSYFAPATPGGPQGAYFPAPSPTAALWQKWKAPTMHGISNFPSTPPAPPPNSSALISICT